MKRIIRIIEYLVVFIFLLILCSYINKDLIIKALYKDDLFYWSWFPGTNFFDFAIKVYEGNTKYRPFFDMLIYLDFFIAGNNPQKFFYFNIILNTIVALFIYYFSNKLFAGRLISILISFLYIISHFAYYQIGQVIGVLESEALLFALIILFIALKLVGVINTYFEDEANNKVKIYNIKGVKFSDKDIVNDDIYIKYKNNFFFKNQNTILSILMLFFYFIVSFTHERYLCLAPLVFLSIIFAKNRNINNDEDKKGIFKCKLCILISFFIECILIVSIRYFTIGKIVPAGTGGTYVEETFKFTEFLKYVINQFLLIFGINVGPEHLVGIEYANIINVHIKICIILSIIIILIIFSIYIVKKINLKRNNKVNNYIIPDIIFILFIIMCITASSVSIRVEMRFVYISFIVMLLYIAYMCGFITKEYYKILDNKLLKLFFILIINILFVIFFTTRFKAELFYRTYLNKVHCIVDEQRVNSLYDNTIGKYGLDNILNNKRVYILYNQYEMTDFYADYIFKVYDKKLKGNKIIFLKDISELPSDATKDNSIVLLEDFYNNGYIEANIWQDI